MPDILKKLEGFKYNSVFQSIKGIPSQFESAFVSDVKIPESYKNINNIVVCGMGGSALAAHIVKALDNCSVPFCFYSGYVPPKYIDEKSLFIAMSYSGSTEEVLASLKIAKEKKARVAGVTAGGKLAKKLREEKYPALEFKEKFNPSGQPRYGIGYMLGGLFNILLRVEKIDYEFDYLKDVAFELAQPSIEEAQNLADQLGGTAPIIVASEFMEGNAHVLANQINEDCKTYAEYHSIPELNHHLMEGLKRPSANRKNLKFLFLESDLYSKQNQTRMELTKAIVQKNNIGYTNYKARGSSALKQVLNTLIFSGMASLLLAIKYNEDPTAIPFVDYFKAQLKKMMP